MRVPTQAKAVTGEQGSGFGSAQKVEELAGSVPLLRPGKHYGRLIERGIGIEWDDPVAALVFHRGCERMRERDQSCLRVARFDELRGLRDVFSDDEAAGDLIVESKMPQRGFGGAPVRRSRWIRDRNFLDRRIEQRLDAECRYVERRFGWNPQYETADGIAVERVFGCQSFGDQLLWVFFVGGEEDVKGSPVSDLIG